MASLVSPSELEHYFSSPCRSLIHFNARSLRKHTDDITNFLSSVGHRFSIICLTETWLSISDKNLYDFPSYSAEYCHRAGSSHGGAAIFISSGFHYHRRHDLTLNLPSCESVWAEFHESFFSQDGKNIIVGCIYRSPSSSTSEFCLALSEVLHRLSIERKNVIILGDININLIDTNTSCYNEYINCLNGNGYECLITTPTRCTASGQASLIDHALSNLLTSPDAGVIEVSITDHYPVFVRLNFVSHENDVCLTRKKVNTSLFVELISNSDWSAVTNVTHPEVAFDELCAIITRALAASSSITTCKKNTSTPYSPWMTFSLLRCLRKKDNLYKKTKRQPFNLPLKIRFRNYSNTLARLLKDAKRRFYENEVHRAGNDVKKQWKILNSFLNRTTTTAPINSVQFGNVTYNNPSDIANAFSDSFFTDHPQPFIPHDHHYQRLPHSFFLFPVSPVEVRTVIHNLKITSAGLDNFYSFHIKLIAHLICDVLSYIINLVFKTGVFPSVLKVAKLIPVFKKGDKRLVTNYRPIAILSFFSKIIEKLVVIRLTCYLSKFNVLSPRQFGFRAGFSTDLALISLTDDIKRAIDCGKFAGALFIDLSKAFDSINHNILFAKLDAIGITGPTLALISNYLQDRQQVVYISGAYSHFRTTNIGVPQGSILGPLLFLIYINDLPQCINFSDCLLYADDTTIFTSDNSLDSLLLKINADAANVANWCRRNILNINASKSTFVIFTSTNKIVPGLPSVHLNSNVLTAASHVVFLGVELDTHLKFHRHINSLTRKAAFGIRALIKVRAFFHIDTLISLYYAFIHSHLNYCISSWGNTYRTHLSPLQHVQNQAFRIITFSHFSSDISWFFRAFNILSVSNLNKHTLGLLVYNFVNGKLALTLLNDNQFPQHKITRFAFHHNLLLPKPRTNYGKFTTNFSATAVWNSLPLAIKQSPSIHVFKQKLRIFLQSF